MEEDDAISASEDTPSPNIHFPLPPLIPFHRSFPLDSPFFDEGNEDRDHLTKLASLPTTSSTPHPLPVPLPSSFFYCNAPHCQSTFSSLSSFHHHYVSTHSHVCVGCGRRFLSLYLMGLHQHERHSPMFLVQRDRGESVYACLTEGCQWKGRTRKARRGHMVSQHQWHPNFVFDETLRKGQGGRTVKAPRRVWKEKDRDDTSQQKMEEALHEGEERTQATGAGHGLPLPSPSTSLSTFTGSPLVPSSTLLPVSVGTASALLRFTPRQLQRPPPTPIRSIPSSHASAMVDASAFAGSVLPQLESRGVEEIGLDGGKVELMLEELERKEAMEEEGMTGDEAMDEEMATVMSTLHSVSRSAQRVPSQVTFGHKRNEMQYGGG